MTGPSIELRLRPEAAAPSFELALAGGRLVCDQPIRPGAPVGPALPPRPLPAVRSWRTVYRGPGLAEGRIQEVVATAAPPLHRVGYADGESFLASNEGWIAREPGGAGPGPHSLERALGAPLALLLAGRGLYLLHASAIEVGAGAIALVGESGAGKSTLARAAAEAGFLRLADDQLPVRFGERPATLPHFPQLKLSAWAWYAEDRARELPLAAVVAFRHAAGLAGCRLRRLDAAAACLRLVGSTVAARLFGPAALEAHLAEAAAAAARLAIFELEFPSGPAGLGEALEVLETLV